MAMAVGDVIKVNVVQTWDLKDDIQNTFHFLLNATPTPLTASALVADCAELLGTAYAHIAGNLSNLVDPVSINVYNVTQDQPMGISSWGGGYTGGTSAGEGLPPQDALLMILTTQQKRVQGRVYFGGFTEAQQSNGVWGGTVLTNAGLVIDELTSAAAMTLGSELQMIVYSRGSGMPHPIYGVRPAPIVARMGTRKPGRGS